MKPFDLAGRKFGKLTANHIDGKYGTSNVWSCTCECGNTTRVRANRLASGRTQSCGCAMRDWSHGHTRGGVKSPTFSSWSAMISRCTQRSNPAYEYYRSRNITVCERWRSSFEAFLADVGERPSLKHSLDRIDNERGYEPGNVRWATKTEQANNRVTNIWYEYEGERLTFMGLVRRSGLPKEVLRSRIRRGSWPLDLAMTTPVLPKGKVRPAQTLALAIRSDDPSEND